jgi:hypothetical protein
VNVLDNLDKLIKSIDFVQASTPISDTPDVFIVWRRDSKTSELIPLILFTDMADAKMYRDILISGSPKSEDVNAIFVVGYFCRHLFGEEYIL